jgi:hypothetical protein
MEVSVKDHAEPALLLGMNPCTHQTERKLGVPQSLSRRFGEDQHLLSLPRHEIRAKKK